MNLIGCLWWLQIRLFPTLGLKSITASDDTPFARLPLHTRSAIAYVVQEKLVYRTDAMFFALFRPGDTVQPCRFQKAPAADSWTGLVTSGKRAGTRPCFPKR